MAWAKADFGKLFSGGPSLFRAVPALSTGASDSDGFGKRLWRLLKGFANPNVDFINAPVMMYLHDGGLLNKNAKRLFWKICLEPMKSV